MMRSAVLSLLFIGSLAACGGSKGETGIGTAKHALTASELPLTWSYLVMGPTGGEGRGFEITSDAGRLAMLQAAQASKAHVCAGDASCMQNVAADWHVELCAHSACDYPSVAAEVGWASLTDRYSQEWSALIAFLEAQNQEAESVRLTLVHRQTHQSYLSTSLADAVSGKLTSTQIANAAHDRLAEMGATVTSAEQVQLADTRRIIARLDEVTTSYSTELNRIQPAYGDVAARHTSYRATEDSVFAAIGQLASQASTANLSTLSTLKVQLGAQSDSENRTPQLVIIDAKRVQWELAYAQATYEAGLAPYSSYLTEKSLPVLDHTGAPKSGMENVVGYAEGRMRRVNDAVRAIYDGIRRREAALSLVAADAATRDQLRATDDAARESEFLDEITTRATAMWKLPPTGALGLQLQTERMTTMTAFLQLEEVCHDLTGAATWRAPGCQKVAGEASKVRTYLTQTLPFTLKFGVQKMRASGGFDADALADIEAKVVAGQLLLAVHIYDATISTGARS